MATFNIAANGDDGHCNNAASPVFTNTGNWVTMGRSSTNYYSGFFRFDDITIPAGSTIDTCKVTFQSVSNKSGNDANFNIYFCDEDDADAPTSVNSFNEKPLTDAVTWNAVSSWSTGSNYDTPELKTILQTVIDREGWASGQAVCLMVNNNSSTSGAYRQAKSKDGASAPAILTVTYTAPSVGTNTKVNIGDTWKDVSEMKINIGDTWKNVVGVKINIGDTWKDVFS